jgi:hypothetical protein
MHNDSHELVLSGDFVVRRWRACWRRIRGRCPPQARRICLRESGSVVHDRRPRICGRCSSAIGGIEQPGSPAWPKPWPQPPLWCLSNDGVEDQRFTDGNASPGQPRRQGRVQQRESMLCRWQNAPARLAVAPSDGPVRGDGVRALHLRRGADLLSSLALPVCPGPWVRRARPHQDNREVLPYVSIRTWRRYCQEPTGFLCKKKKKDHVAPLTLETFFFNISSFCLFFNKC